MATLVVLRPTLAGALRAPVTPTAGTGDVFDNDGYTVLVVTNASGSSINVTIDTPLAVGPDNANAFDSDLVRPVAAGATRVFGPFTDKARFNDANGQVKATISLITSVTIEAIRVY